MRNVTDKIIAFRQKYQYENIDVMQLLVKSLLNSLYGEQIRKDFEESFACKSEAWMVSEHDERFTDYRRISHVKYIVKMIDDEGLEDEVERLNTMPPLTLNNTTYFSSKDMKIELQMLKVKQN